MGQDDFWQSAQEVQPRYSCSFQDKVSISSPDGQDASKRLQINLVVGTMFFAAIGGQPLALVTGFLDLGAKVGELIGWFTPRVGAGLGVAGVISAIGLFIGLQEVESEQCELDAVQKELEKYRKT